MDADTVVSLEWLSESLDDPTVRPVDVRDPWEYSEIGHIPGAVNIPFDTIRDPGDDDRGMLPGVDRVEEVFSAKGINRDDVLVPYDDTHGVFAARFLLTALVYGHRNLRFLDGDYSAWTRRFDVTTESPAIEASAYRCRSPDRTDHPLVDRSHVEAAMEDDTVLVDTRRRSEFEEGRIPGSIRFDWRWVVDERSRSLRPLSEIAALFEDHGITRDRDVVLYCNTARRISHTYVVLRLLGYDAVRCYEGSLTEWLDTDGTVESGPVDGNQPG